MQLFYATELEDNILTLSEQESLHCTKVLRMNKGEEIHVTDGKGHFYHGTIQLAHNKRTTVEVKETIESSPPPYQLHLYVALTKHADRLEWMLEKCVELGLTSFTPLVTQRTERKKIRTDRLQLIALSAMKQSLKAWLTEVNEPLLLKNAIKSDTSVTKMIAYCDTTNTRHSITDIEMGKRCSIYIGPEGDFTIDEIEWALHNGFTGIELGNSRLRTETAALTACNWMYWYNIKTQ